MVVRGSLPRHVRRYDFLLVLRGCCQLHLALIQLARRSRAHFMVLATDKLVVLTMVVPTILDSVLPESVEILPGTLLAVRQLLLSFLFGLIW